MSDIPVQEKLVAAASPQRLPVLRLPIDAIFIPSDVDGTELRDQLEDQLARGLWRIHLQITPYEARNSEPTSPWAQEFWVPNNGETIRITVDEIDLITAERDYMRLHVGNRSYLLLQTISELVRCLDPAKFIRVHRSAIVRRDFVLGFKCNADGAWQVHLRDGRWQRVGRTYLSDVRAIAGR